MWHQIPCCLSKLQNTNITAFLFLFSVKHVSDLHCAIKRRQFRRVQGRAECSQLAEYTNLFGAESEGTPTNHFLHTGHSLQGAGRSPAHYWTQCAGGRGVFQTQCTHMVLTRRNATCQIHETSLPRVFQEFSWLQNNCRSNVVWVKQSKLHCP